MAATMTASGMPCPATSPATNRPGSRDPRPRTEAVMGPGDAAPEPPIRNDAATISIIRPPSSAR
jgi:hypothetical protein